MSRILDATSRAAISAILRAASARDPIRARIAEADALSDELGITAMAARSLMDQACFPVAVEDVDPRRAAIRPCIRCRREIFSMHVGHRMCASCRAYAAVRSDPFPTASIAGVRL